VLDGLDERRITVFRTQKLCVGLRSIVAVLSRRGDAGDHLALGATERSRREHDLVEKSGEQRPDRIVGSDQPPHRRHEPEVVRVILEERREGLRIG
jgi:hypothetical protein